MTSSARTGSGRHGGCDCQQEGAEKRSSRPYQSPGDKIEPGHGEHPEERRQEVEPKLIERHQWPHQVVVEQVQERPRVAEPRIDGIPQG